MGFQKPPVSVLCIAMALLLIDAISKYLTQEFIPLMGSESLWYPYGGMGVFRNLGGIEFSIVHAINKGAAWSSFSDYQGILLMLRLVLIGGLITYALTNRNASYLLPLSLIISGALGNVIDYFFYGHVIDMFHFVFWGYHYPVFNIADSAIVVGIGWLFLLTLKKKTPSPARQRTR